MINMRKSSFLNGDALQAKLKSMNVYAYPVLFSENNYEGQYSSFALGTYSANDVYVALTSDTVKSIYVPPNRTIYIQYIDGTDQTLTESQRTIIGSETAILRLTSL